MRWASLNRDRKEGSKSQLLASYTCGEVAGIIIVVGDLTNLREELTYGLGKPGLTAMDPTS
jgi:hypothetical protein